MAIMRGKGVSWGPWNSPWLCRTAASRMVRATPDGCFCGHNTHQSDSQERLIEGAHCEVGCTLDYFQMTGAAAATECLLMMCWESQTLIPITWEHRALCMCQVHTGLRTYTDHLSHISSQVYEVWRGLLPLSGRKNGGSVLGATELVNPDSWLWKQNSRWPCHNAWMPLR